jgi:hypothetical protein
MLKESDLNQYQLDALDFLEKKGSALLALDLGLGKSVISATYQRNLLYSFMAKHCLIVAPKKVALNTWPDELSKWEHLKDLTVVQLTGLKPAERKKLAGQLGDITVINRENLGWLIELWGDEWPYDSIVLDEAKWCCTGVTFKKLKRVRQYINYATLLTGTPAPNGHMDLFGQAFMVDGGKALEKTITAFRNRYYDRNYMGFGYDIKEWAPDVINERMKNIALYMAVDDHLDLPPFVPRTTRVTLPPKLWEKYEIFKKDFITEVDAGVIVADSSAILSNKLLQFCSGNVYDEDRNVHHFHTVKLDMLEEIVKDTSSPVLCAYGYQHEIPGLRERFPKAEFMGDDPNTVKRWNYGEIPLLFCHPASASMGLNLQHGGNVLIWFSLTWNLEHYQQFNYRLRRRGQKAGSVIINHIVVKGTIEEKLIKALNTKAITQQELLNTLRIEA